jgi:hypothetical protein
MILAEVSSGRSLLATSSPTKVDRPGSAAAATLSTAALPPSPVAAKVEVRTVMTFFLGLHRLDRVAGIDRPPLNLVHGLEPNDRLSAVSACIQARQCRRCLL